MLDDNTTILQAAHALDNRCPHLADALRDIVRRDVVRGGAVKRDVREVLISSLTWKQKHYQISEIVES